jgi:hypothetical protein
MTSQKSWWSQVKLPDDLREFIVLSAMDITQLTTEAAQAADPVAHLTERLVAIGEAKRKVRDEHKQARMKQDAARITLVDSWPHPTVLRMKEQPWIKANGRRYGSMHRASVRNGEWAVRIDGEDQPERFKSLEELVQVWSVD